MVLVKVSTMCTAISSLILHSKVVIFAKKRFLIDIREQNVVIYSL